MKYNNIDMRLREIKEQITFTTIEEPAQRVVINGQLAEMPGQRHTVIVCPICGNVLVDLQQEIPAYAIHEIIERYISRKPRFCDQCGQKLDWDIGAIVEGSILEERNQETNEN